MKLGYKNVKVFAAGYPAWKKFAGEGPKMAAIPGAVKKATSKSIKAGKEDEFIKLMKEIVPKVRAESGNITYTMLRSKNDPRVFLFFEEYADQEAFQAHTRHIDEFGIDFSVFFDGPPVAEYYEKIAE